MSSDQFLKQITAKGGSWARYSYSAPAVGGAERAEKPGCRRVLIAAVVERSGRCKQGGQVKIPRQAHLRQIQIEVSARQYGRIILPGQLFQFH